MIDIILLIIVASFGINGFFKGFVRAAGCLAGDIFSIIFASKLYGIAGLLLNKYISNINISNIAGFLIVFSIFSISFRIILTIVSKIFELPLINFANKTLGLCFGIFEALFICGFTINLFINFPLTSEITKNFTKDSTFSPIMIDISRFITPILPKVLTDINSIPGVNDLKDLNEIGNMPEIKQYFNSLQYGYGYSDVKAYGSDDAI